MKGINKFLAKNRQELLSGLLAQANMTGDDIPLALAYLINEVCPEDRTTKRIFQRLSESAKKEGE